MELQRYDLLRYYRILLEAGLAEKAEFCNKESFEPIKSLSYDSNEVCEGGLFVCKGNHFKKEYLYSAIEKGAGAYISEVEYELREDIPHIIVSDIREALAVVSNLFFNYAWQGLNIIGVTGTKGKSTICYFIKYILDSFYKTRGENPCGIISTIDTYDGKIFKESLNSTPESYNLQEHYRNALDSGLQTVITEVSSQALKYSRVSGIVFDTGVFINIGEDHISPIEHSDFEDYFKSKLKLFDKCHTACVNISCEEGLKDRILDAAKKCSRVITFGYDEKADVYGYDIRKEGFATFFRCRTADFDEEFELQMPGIFNVDNALAAIAAISEMKIDAESIRNGLKNARASGRMELYYSENKSVIACVDYAHNALSFEKLFESVKKEFPQRYVITVFGCPGDKAIIRRKDLGERAGKYSDFVYITAEDPGYEDPESIACEVAKYVIANGCEYKIINDREEAIKYAILHAPKNSIVLITGKGNETRQKYGSKFIPCHSDSECVTAALSELPIYEGAK